MFIRRNIVALLCGVIAIASCAAPAVHHPESAPYSAVSSHEEARNALAAGRTIAIAEDKLLLVIYGANWCHDSRALAGWLETPRFRALTNAHYSVVYIDAGKPQTNEGRNLDLIAKLGLTDIEGTPNLLVIDPAKEELLNSDTARSWRNAASRSEDAIYDELASFASAAKRQ